LVDVLVGLYEYANGQGAESFDEPLRVCMLTLRKKSVDTCSSMVESNSVTISFRISRMVCGMWGLSMLLMFSFLKMISAFFSHIYSWIGRKIPRDRYRLSIPYCRSQALLGTASLFCLSVQSRRRSS
jgi:hypothetical protein